MADDAGILHQVEQFEERMKLIYLAMSEYFQNGSLIRHDEVFGSPEEAESRKKQTSDYADTLQLIQEEAKRLFPGDVESALSRITPRLGIQKEVYVSVPNRGRCPFPAHYKALIFLVDLLLQEADRTPALAMGPHYRISMFEFGCHDLWSIAKEAIRIHDGVMSEINRAKEIAAGMDANAAREMGSGIDRSRVDDDCNLRVEQAAKMFAQATGWDIDASRTKISSCATDRSLDSNGKKGPERRISARGLSRLIQEVTAKQMDVDTARINKERGGKKSTRANS